MIISFNQLLCDLYGVLFLCQVAVAVFLDIKTASNNVKIDFLQDVLINIKISANIIIVLDYLCLLVIRMYETQLLVDWWNQVIHFEVCSMAFH